MERKMNKKGSMNAFSMLMIGLSFLVLLSGVGYIIGGLADTHNVTINTEFNNVDLQNLTGIEYFTNGTLNYDSSYNVSNTTQTESGYITAVNTLTGTKALIRDLVLVTPLAGTQFGDLLDELIVAVFAIIILTIVVQLLLGRTLTS
tara:strand:- start:824 stop:1261 length:438 start_codon:yes stop_codon:yes gene_type:complete